MFNVKEFWYKTFSKTVEDVIDVEKEETIENAIVVFANVEKEDEEKTAKTINKTVKNITWLAIPLICWLIVLAVSISFFISSRLLSWNRSRL